MAGKAIERYAAEQVGVLLARPDRKDDKTRRFGNLAGVRHWIESVNQSLKSQLNLEGHGGRTLAGATSFTYAVLGSFIGRGLVDVKPLDRGFGCPNFATGADALRSEHRRPEHLSPLRPPFPLFTSGNPGPDPIGSRPFQYAIQRPLQCSP
ncbi:MAG: hypothetical protein SYR96_33790 [Actinomycetota bacterium]|nr:hypothetical protein [Actinomycetota bacterium]